MKKYSLIVPAAGQGNRSGLEYNKILHPLENGRIIDATLKPFLEDPDCREILVMIRKEDEADMKDLEDHPRVRLLQGGETRQDSVWNGLEQASEKLVLVHDGARPYITRELIERLKKAMDAHPAAILAIPVRDTLKRLENGLLKTVEREGLYAAQTPQAFDRDLLVKAYRNAQEKGFQGTDEASLLEAIGEPVFLVSGHPDNKKITDPFDIQNI